MSTQAPVNKPIVVGKISGVFGVQGWVKIFSHTEPRENILNYSPWLIKKKNGLVSVELEKGRPQGKTLVAKLKDIDDRNAAELLIGCELSIDEGQLKKLPEGDFYWRDIQGLDVFSADGEHLGKVAYMMETGANDVMVVKLTKDKAEQTNQKEMLIPYLFEQVVTKIDLENGSVEVDWEEEFE